MSHLRPEDRRNRHTRALCKKGRHFYGEARTIGGGIRRQVCETCGDVTIDLTGAEPLNETTTRLAEATGSLTLDS
ncbi:MAG TPA: hypothetical protein VG872_08880 [Acidimicrobiia bacterium]|nr:hypothetical protein [Acidimicrobiia bacterium]